jgi:predicted ATPase
MSQVRPDPPASGPGRDRPPGDELTRQIETALERLHDLPYLQPHPLAALLRAREPEVRAEAAGRALQRCLLEAVEALRPGGGRRDAAGARVHAVLVRRYVEAEDVATASRALGIHERTLYRAQAAGLAAVADLLRERWPAAPAGDPPRPRTNLPRELTSFVGREREVEAVTKLLGTSPLVTLTGAGGVGKTRLALRVGAELPGSYPDGVWFVDLTPLADPALVPKAVGAVLGLAETAHEPILTTVITYLRNRRLLLVLDNCEHLVEACAGLAQAVLRSCAGASILATSRERLGVDGEVSWRVPSLRTLSPADLRPDGTDLVSVGGRCDAIRLFVERARSVQTGFGLTEQNVAPVAQVCWRLDGIPLAVELAAARVRVLTVEQIAARLDDRFRLLTDGSRTAARRHQTLRAAIDWSHDLLAESERVVLRRLAVFAGGGTIEAAEAVCADAQIEPDQLLDLLAHLVDKSLVVVEEQADEARYRLPETIRQYAAERLDESGEADEIGWRHADYYRLLAERAEPGIWGGSEMVWVRRVESEHPNLRAAVAWFAERGDAESGMRLCGRLWGYWYARGQQVEIAGWLRSLLALPSAAAPSIARGMALYTLGHAAYMHGEYEVARGYAAESLSLFERFGERWWAAWAMAVLGHLARHSGDGAAARSCYMDALGLFVEVGHASSAAWVLGFLGELALRDGDDGAARAWFERSVATGRNAGDRYSTAGAVLGLATIALDRGDLSEARARYEEALGIARDLGARPQTVQALRGLGSVVRAEGDLPAAGALYAESLAVAQQAGMRNAIAPALEVLGGLAASRGQPECAVRLVGAAVALREATGMKRTPAEREEVERWLASARQALGEQAATDAWRVGQAMTADEAIGDALRSGPG